MHGGARAISEADLHDRYHTYCDHASTRPSDRDGVHGADLLKAQRLARPSDLCGRLNERSRAALGRGGLMRLSEYARSRDNNFTYSG